MCEVTYVAPYPVPSVKADAGQDVAMCTALARHGARVRLVHGRAPEGFPADLFAHYGVDREFSSQPLAHDRLDGLTRRLARRQGRPASVALAAASLSRSLLVAHAAARPRSDWYFTKAPVAGWWLARSGRRVVWEAASFPSRSDRPLVRRLLRSRNLLLAFAITAGLAEDLEGLARPRRPVHHLPVGVDVARYAAPLTGANACHMRAGTDSGQPVVVYTGWMRPDRGVDVIVRTAALLPAVRFVLVGGRDAEIADLRRLAGDLCATNIEFTGPVAPPTVPSYQRTADVLLLPQQGSTRHLTHHVSPAKLFEYMAAGRPIIAADLPCIREVVRDGDNGLLVPPGDPQVWAQTISTVLEQPELGRSLAAAARREAPRYDWTRRAERVLAWAGRA